jgi:hypothetical protein
MDSQIDVCDDSFYLQDGEADECLHCVPVDNSAADAALTCSDAMDSQITGCDTGYFLTDGVLGGDADTCTEMTCAESDSSGATAFCGIGATCSEAGTGDGYTCTCDTGFTGATTINSDATCSDNVCSCNDGTMTLGGAGQTAGTLCEQDGVADCSACNPGFTMTATAGTGEQTCFASPCDSASPAVSVTITDPADSSHTSTDDLVLTTSQVVASGATGTVDCAAWHSGWTNGAGGISVSCLEGVISYDSDMCTSSSPCDSSEDNCVVGATCEHTGPGTHSCTCPLFHYGDGETGSTECTEETCAATESGTDASCGADATCSEGGSGDGYTCTCDAAFFGTTTTNGEASCTGALPTE